MPSRYAAQIDWGDGTPTSTGGISWDGGNQFDIAGSHTYDDPGSYTITVTVSDTGILGSTATAYSTAEVSDGSGGHPGRNHLASSVGIWPRPFSPVAGNAVPLGIGITYPPGPQTVSQFSVEGTAASMPNSANRANAEGTWFILPADGEQSDQGFVVDGESTINWSSAEDLGLIL